MLICGMYGKLYGTLTHGIAYTVFPILARVLDTHVLNSFFVRFSS